MGLKDKDATCFDQAKARRRRSSRDSASGDGFSVVLMEAPPRRIVPEPSDDGRRVVAEIEAVHMPHGNADLAATLNTVESLVQASPNKFADKQVYFLTDLQQSTWIARQPASRRRRCKRFRPRPGRCSSTWAWTARPTWPSRA